MMVSTVSGERRSNKVDCRHCFPFLSPNPVSLHYDQSEPKSKTLINFARTYTQQTETRLNRKAKTSLNHQSYNRTLYTNKEGRIRSLESVITCSNEEANYQSEFVMKLTLSLLLHNKCTYKIGKYLFSSASKAIMTRCFT